MSVFTPPNGTPKDVNNRLGSVKSLDPDDPNDTAFKLVTICVFILCRKKQTIFSFFVNRIVDSGWVSSDDGKGNTGSEGKT